MHLALLVEAGDGLGADPLAAGSVHALVGNVRPDRADVHLDEIPAIIYFRHYAVGLVRLVRVDRPLGPLVRAALAGEVLEHESVLLSLVVLAAAFAAALADAGDDDP